eukprot:7958159-Karenia_brevis.AAC.1
MPEKDESRSRSRGREADASKDISDEDDFNSDEEKKKLESMGAPPYVVASTLAGMRQTRKASQQVSRKIVRIQDDLQGVKKDVGKLTVANKSLEARMDK